MEGRKSDKTIVVEKPVNKSEDIPVVKGVAEAVERSVLTERKWN